MAGSDGHRGGAPALVGGLLPALGLGEHDLLLGRIQHAWSELLPSRVRAWPVGLRADRLDVVAATAAWAQELTLLAPRLCARLRVRVPEASFRGLRVRVGPVPRVRGRQGSPVAPEPLPTVPLPPELARAIEAIEDEALRACFREAAAVGLAAERRRAARSRGLALRGDS